MILKRFIIITFTVIAIPFIVKCFPHIYLSCKISQHTIIESTMLFNGRTIKNAVIVQPEPFNRNVVQGAE